MWEFLEFNHQTKEENREVSTENQRIDPENEKTEEKTENFNKENRTSQKIYIGNNEKTRGKTGKDGN